METVLPTPGNDPVPGSEPEACQRAVGAAKAALGLLKTVPPHGRLNEYKAALGTLKAAVAAAAAYRERPGTGRDAIEEGKLSRLWRAAAERIGPINPALAQLCRVTGAGWARAAVWDEPHHQDLVARLEAFVPLYVEALKPVRDHATAMGVLERLRRRLAADERACRAVRILAGSSWMVGASVVAPILSGIVLVAAIAGRLPVPVAAGLVVAGLLGLAAWGAARLRQERAFAGESFPALMRLVGRQMLPAAGLDHRRDARGRTAVKSQ